jgi:hypothetical protein
MHVCWAEDVAEARRTAHRWWPNAAWPTSLSSELARPTEFEAVAGLLDEATVAGAVPCGPDPEPMVRAVLRFAAAGYDRVYVHQIGPDQEGFLRFWAKEVAPLLASGPA